MAADAERLTTAGAWERAAYGAAYLWAGLAQLCLLARTFGTDDCRGPGARYPGGCPAFADAAHILEAAVVAGSLLAFAGLLWLLGERPMRASSRALIVGAALVAAAALPLLCALIPLPPKS